jgi:hypothetical protein
MKRFQLALLLWAPALVLSVLLLGCGDSKDKDAKKDGTPSADGKPPKDGGGVAPKGVAFTKNGVLKGKATFVGTMPDLKALTEALQKRIATEKAEDAIKSCLCDEAKKKGDADYQEWKIDKDQGVANVVVFLKPVRGTYFEVDETHPAVMAIKGKEAVLDQPFCAFEPHVQVLYPRYIQYKDGQRKMVSTGQSLIVKNSSKITHNTNMKDPNNDNKLPNNPVLKPDENVSVKNDDLAAVSQPIDVSCDIHKWMKGYIWVLGTPYYAVTNAKGEYEIKNVPAGPVQLIAWHEKAGFLTSGEANGEPLDLKDGENSKNFEVKEK